MTIQSCYKRILIKITGEALKGNQASGYEAGAIAELAQTLKSCRDKYNIQMAIVLGGGNLWRGAIQSNKGKMDRVTADYMGMLATVMNALALQDALKQIGADAIVQTSIPMTPIATPFQCDTAIQHLEAGRIVIFAGGTGSPFFTTDTTATLRALETRCQAIFKATKVDGIYSADPFKDPNAVRYEKISFEEVISKQLAVMDLTAFSMCHQSRLPIIVFNFAQKENLDKVLIGDNSIATVVE